MNDDRQTSIFRQESLERLSSPEQLDQLMQVVNSRSWLALGTLGAIVFLALIWSIFGRIPIAATGRGILVHPENSSNQLVGLIYFDRHQAEEIRSGMPVAISPDMGTEVGGRVQSVAVAPVTTLDAARRDRTLMDALEQESIEVLVDLDSSSNLSAGMMTTARITVARKAPIALAFPFLEGSR